MDAHFRIESDGTTLTENSQPQLDTGLACLTMLVRFHEMAADAEQLRHQFARPGEAFDTTDMLRAAKSLGLKAKSTTSNAARLAKTPLPAIAEHQDGHFFVIAKASEDKVLIQDSLA